MNYEIALLLTNKNNDKPKERNKCTQNFFLYFNTLSIKMKKKTFNVFFPSKIIKSERSSKRTFFHLIVLIIVCVKIEAYKNIGILI